MSRKMRKTSTDKKLINNMNNKIRRRFKNAQEHGFDYSTDFSIRTMRDFDSRDDFNDYIASAKTFTNIHNGRHKFLPLKDGTFVTKKRYDTMVKNARLTNIHRKKHIKKMELLKEQHGSKDVALSAYEYGNTTSDVKLVHEPKSSLEFANQKAFNRTEKYREEQASPSFIDQKGELGRDNFLATLRSSIPESGEIADKLQAMDIEDFWYLYSNNEDFAKIFYDSDQYKEMLVERGMISTHVTPKLESLYSAYDRFMLEKMKTNNKE